MSGLAMIGAIAFDPTVRGILVVVVGTTVLMGSIFMILSTNSGVRVGSSSRCRASSPGCS